MAPRDPVRAADARGSARSCRSGRAVASTLAALAVAACGWEDTPGRAAFSDVAVVAATGGSQPTVALTGSGEILTVWVGEDHNVWLHGSGRSGLARVNDLDGDAAPHAQAPAQVAAAPDGSVYVVWHNEQQMAGRRFPASDVRFARSLDGGRTFAPAVTVNDDAGGVPSSHTFQDLAVGADGAVVVSWIDARARDGGGDPGQANGPPHAGHGTSAGSGRLPGVVRVADPPPGERGPEIRVARSTDGGRTFGAGAVVSVDACPCCRTAMAVAPDGIVYLAWRHIFEGSVRDVVLARSDDGGVSFEDAVRVHADGWVFDRCPHAGPTLAVAPDGALHVAWYTGREGAAGLFHAVSRDGGRSFGAPQAVLAGDWVPPSTARLAVTDDGTVWLAYEDRRPETPVVRVARVGPEGALESIGVEIAGLAPDMPPRSGNRPVLVLLERAGGAVLATAHPGAPR